WEQASRQLNLLPPSYHVFDEDIDLIAKFRAGNSEARTELGRRGRILSALMVFPQPYDKTRWEEAQKTLMDAGEPGQILLSTTLIDILMNGQFQELWDHVRASLVETGPVAFETLVGWARAQVERFRSDTMVIPL